jgi:DNA-binding NtrC family response regulator
MTKSGRAILVLEDEPLEECYRAILEEEGFRIVGATHGSEMLAMLRMERPVLLLTGLNVLKRHKPAYQWALRNAAAGSAGIPMLFVTGASDKNIIMNVPYGARVRILRKPVKAQELGDAVLDLLMGSQFGLREAHAPYGVKPRKPAAPRRRRKK